MAKNIFSDIRNAINANTERKMIKLFLLFAILISVIYGYNTYMKTKTVPEEYKGMMTNIYYTVLLAISLYIFFM